jgi:hypothetical protein
VSVSAAGGECAGPAGHKQDIQRTERTTLIMAFIASSIELGKGL